MKKQIDRILICVLWLLAATLGTCFWLNTVFGFNIFSAQHWQYLSYMQAAQAPVRPAFYISLSCAIIITLVGLYILIRPRGLLRKRIGIGRAARAAAQPAQPTAADATAPATTQNTMQSAATPPAATAQNTAVPVPPAPQAPNLQRPRPLGGTPRMAPAAPAPQTAPVTQPVVKPAAIDFEQLQKIFSDAGYVVKRSPRIANFKPAVFAIGTEETLWLGGAGIDTATVANAIERLDTIFTDTLDDIQINISGFIIAPPAGATETNNIHLFRTPDDLKEYISAHPNTPPADADGQENFDAYSEYIDTVINYMDKT